MEEEVKTVKKAAEAMTEVAKVTGRAIDAASAFGQWLDRIFGDTVESGAGLVSQELRYLQIKRAISLSEKVEDRMRKTGITDIRSISPKIGLPILQNAALEENDDLHDLWANLLASALNPEAANVERSFVSILEDLSANDAAAFERIATAWNNGNFVQIGSAFDGISTEKCVLSVPTKLGVLPSAEQMIPVFNLARLGLLRPSNSTATISSITPDLFRPDNPKIQQITVRVANDLNIVVLTPLGSEFWKAIQPH